MESRFRSNYFTIVKFAGLAVLVLAGVTLLPGTVMRKAWLFLTGAAFVLCSVMLEADDADKRKIWLAGEGIPALLSVFLFPVCGIFFAAVVWLDIVGRRDTRAYAVCWLPVLLAGRAGLGTGVCFLLLTLIMLVYWQHYKVVCWYRDVVAQDVQSESRIKADIARTGALHRDELKKTRLQSENAILEEKARIAQALHDKLGHSINGSVYKLEAAKVLIEKKPEESTRILQEVIDNLRGSMDEIRVIIRNERPDKSRSSENALRNLCAECEEQYGISAGLTIEPDGRGIPDAVWDVILDNAFEAVTNSLKYSGCDRIDIRITVMEKVVRCTISDNGRGAESFTEGMGIEGMKQRVRAVRGYFDIESDRGFAINMILPIK